MFNPQKSEAQAHLPPLQCEGYCSTMQVQNYEEILRPPQARMGFYTLLIEKDSLLRFKYCVTRPNVPSSH